MPILLYDKGSKGSESYLSLAKELIRSVQKAKSLDLTGAEAGATELSEIGAQTAKLKRSEKLSELQTQSASPERSEKISGELSKERSEELAQELSES